MRLGGAFPFSIADLINGGGQVVLPSGGVFYPPSGNYIAMLGGQTMLQFFDPIGLQWRGVATPGQDYLAFDTDGSNWRLANLSGVVVGASITAVGSGGVNGIGSGTGANQTTASVTFGAPASPGRTAIGYPIVGGAVVAPTVNQAGSGFLEPPLVVVDPPPLGGVQATAFCTLTAVGGGIASVTMLEPGAGYLTAPNFWLIPQSVAYLGSPLGNGTIAAPPLTPPGTIATANSPTGVVPVYTAGTGALLNAATLTGSGTLTAIVIVDPGSLYTGTNIPTITVANVGAAAATAVMSLSMTGASAIVTGAGYTGTPPLFETSLGVVTLRQGNNVFLPRAARGVTTLSGGGILALVIEDPGFGFQKVPTGAVINAGSIASGQGTFTPTVGGITDVSILQPRIAS